MAFYFLSLKTHIPIMWLHMFPFFVHEAMHTL